MLKPGDRVRMVEQLPGARGMIYKPGMTARVVKVSSHEVWVEWDDGTLKDHTEFFWEKRFEKIADATPFDDAVNAYIRSELHDV